MCKGCGGPLKNLAYINDQISIKRILDFRAMMDVKLVNQGPVTLLLDSRKG